MQQTNMPFAGDVSCFRASSSARNSISRSGRWPGFAFYPGQTLLMLGKSIEILYNRHVEFKKKIMVIYFYDLKRFPIREGGNRADQKILLAVLPVRFDLRSFRVCSS